MKQQFKLDVANIRPRVTKASLMLLGALLVILSLDLAVASPQRIEVLVLDHDNTPVENAIVIFKLPQPHEPVNQTPHTIKQFNQSFTPSVIAVPVGTVVEFPNMDRMRHHVYSFSDAKRFELRLYSGQETPQILFDEPGIVSLGCNIHDWMRGYIFVTESPYTAVTDKRGMASLAATDVNADVAGLSIWHPDLDQPQEFPYVQSNGTDGQKATVVIAKKLSPIKQARPTNDPLSARFEMQRKP